MSDGNFTVRCSEKSEQLVVQSKVDELIIND